ncbi:MAG: hypothetical protein ACOCSD_06715 [Halolamina sp.]
MHVPPRTTDNLTYRHPPTFGMMLLLTALPLTVLFVLTFPEVTVGVVVGAAAGTALQR